MRGEDDAGGGGVDVVGLGVDVAEDGRRTDVVYGAGGGEEGEAGDEDGVAGADAEGAQRQEERVGPAGEPDRMLDVAVRGGGVLESLDVRSEDELTALQHVTDRRVDFGADGAVLTNQIQQRNCVRGPGSVVRGQRTRIRGARHLSVASIVGQVDPPSPFR